MELLVLVVLAIPVLAIVALILAGSASARVRTLEDTLKQRITRLERGLRRLEAAPPVPAAPASETTPAPEESTEPQEEPLPFGEPEDEPVAAPVPPPPPGFAVAYRDEEAEPAGVAASTPRATERIKERVAPRSKATGTLEERIGGKWFNWIGIVALLIGVSYLIKYAHEQGWISPWMQFALGLVVAFVMLVAGHLAHERTYTVLSRGLWGGAIGILFLDLFAGYRIHGILSQTASYTGMTLATVLGTTISIVYRARSAAALAALGGYLTPFLLWTGPPSQAFLFTYLAILTAGLLLIGWWRAWRFLRPVALAGSVGWFLAGWIQLGVGDADLLVVLVSVFFALFTSDIAAWSIGRRADSDPAARMVLVAVSAVQMAVGLLLLMDRRPDVVGPFLGATAAWLGAGCWLVHRYRAEDRPLARGFGCAGAVVLLFVAPLDPRFEPYGVSIAFAATAFLFLATTRLGSGAWGRAWAQAALLLAAGQLLLVDTGRFFVDVEPYRPLLTWRGLTFGLVFVAYALGWRVFARAEAVAPAPPRGAPSSLSARWAQFEHFVVTMILVAATTLPLVFLSLELRDALAHYVRPTFGDQEEAWVKNTNYWMTLLWIVYITILLTLGRRRGSLVLVRLGLTMGVIVLWKLIAGDIAHLYQPETTPLLNLRFLVLAVLAGGLFWTSRVFARAGPEATTIPVVTAVLLVLGHATVQLGLALEWHDFVTARAPTGAWAGADLLGLAVLAAAHGAALVAYAARRRVGPLLVPGLALLLMGATEYVFLCVLGGYPPAIHLVLHLRFGAGAAVAAALFLAASALRRVDDGTKASWSLEMWVATLAVIGHLTVLATLGSEGVDVFRRHALEWTAASPFSVVKGAPLALGALGGVYGAALLVAGLRRARTYARGLGLLLLTVTSGGFVLAVFAGGYVVAGTAVLDTRLLFGGLLVLALFVGGEACRRLGASLEGDDPLGEMPDARRWRTPLVLAGHGVALLLLTMEANDVFTLRGEDPEGGISLVHARQLSFSVVWAVYAIGMVVSGILRGFKPVRLMALVLLLGTIFKVFLFDLSFLENPYRILSFLALGLILVGVSYVYQRYKVFLFGEDEPEPEAEDEEP